MDGDFPHWTRDRGDCREQVGHWVRASLRERYGGVLAETLPADWLHMLCDADLGVDSDAGD